MNKTITYYVSDAEDTKIINSISEIANGNGLILQLKELSSSSQVDFMLDVHRDLAVIIDATIPDNLNNPTIYPILTAHVNILNHIILFSRNTDNEGNEILPLNITPQRKRTKEDTDLSVWIETQLRDIISHDGYYERLNVETLDDLLRRRSDMEKMMVASLDIPKNETGRKKSVMISYRNKYADEVKALKESKEEKGDIEVKALPDRFVEIMKLIHL